MEDAQIKNCLTEIEKRLNWGANEQWTNQDFELLSEEIYKKTNINLSITTLKRIWGKVDYQSSPSTTTLNVLAQYLGYKHWRDFQNNHYKTAPIETKEAPHSKKRSFKSIFNQKVVVALVVIIGFSSLFFLIDRRQVFFKAEEVTFSSKMVTTGLPNTVVFNYDVSKVVADSFHIQQSWDRRRRVRISPEESQHTSFYYYPGYFHAKLIANDQIIKKHDVFVESNGWIGMIERFPEPIYIQELVTQDGGMLSADLANYKHTDEHYQDQHFWIEYYFVKDLGQIDANNFEYECRIKNESVLGSVCRESRISLMCTYGRFNIPLCQSGCVGNINLSLGDKYIQGKRNDLSGFGCHLTDWIDFKLKVVNKKCELYINDELIYKNEYTVDLGNIAGFKFKFNGVGSVDYVRLKNHENSMVFEDGFEESL